MWPCWILVYHLPPFEAEYPSLNDKMAGSHLKIIWGWVEKVEIYMKQGWAWVDHFEAKWWVLGKALLFMHLSYMVEIFNNRKCEHLN